MNRIKNPHCTQFSASKKNSKLTALISKCFTSGSQTWTNLKLHSLCNKFSSLMKSSRIQRGMGISVSSLRFSSSILLPSSCHSSSLSKGLSHNRRLLGSKSMRLKYIFRKVQQFILIIIIHDSRKQDERVANNVIMKK